MTSIFPEEGSEFYMWKDRGGGSQMVVRMPPYLFGKVEAWMWISQGGGGGGAGGGASVPEGLMFVPYGVPTRAHWHGPREDFILVQGEALCRVGSRSKWRKMNKSKKVIVPPRMLHDFVATSIAGAWILFKFPGYKHSWHTIRYHFKK